MPGVLFYGEPSSFAVCIGLFLTLSNETLSKSLKVLPCRGACLLLNMLMTCAHKAAESTHRSSNVQKLVFRKLCIIGGHYFFMPYLGKNVGSIPKCFIPPLHWESLWSRVTVTPCTGCGRSGCPPLSRPWMVLSYGMAMENTTCFLFSKLMLMSRNCLPLIVLK